MLSTMTAHAMGLAVSSSVKANIMARLSVMVLNSMQQKSILDATQVQYKVCLRLLLVLKPSGNV